MPSSSPESVADMEVSRYPDLSFIKLELPSPCPSPTLPIMPSAWGKGQSIGRRRDQSDHVYRLGSTFVIGCVRVPTASAVKQEVKLEPAHRGHPSCSNTDLVTIAITLNPVAAQVTLSLCLSVCCVKSPLPPGDITVVNSLLQV